MVKTYRNDGFTVVLDYSGERPTVTYGDGPTHYLHNEEHASGVVQALVSAGYVEV